MSRSLAPVWLQIKCVTCQTAAVCYAVVVLASCNEYGGLWGEGSCLLTHDADDATHVLTYSTSACICCNFTTHICQCSNPSLHQLKHVCAALAAADAVIVLMAPLLITPCCMAVRDAVVDSRRR